MSDAQRALDFAAGERGVAREVRRWAELAARPFRFRLGEEWDDAVQDALAEILRDVRDGRYRGDGAFKGYVWRAVVHTCIDRLRSRRRRQGREGVDAVEAPEPPVPADDPAARLFLLEVARRCPAECCRLWRMILAGLSYREMSTALGVSEGALRVRVLRCRRRAAAVAARLEGEGAGAVTDPAPPTPHEGEGEAP